MQSYSTHLDDLTLRELNKIRQEKSDEYESEYNNMNLFLSQGRMLCEN